MRRYCISVKLLLVIDLQSQQPVQALQIDLTIARYVQKAFRSIDKAAGNDCKIFLIERPPKSYTDDEERKIWVKKLIVNQRPGSGIMEIPEYDRADLGVGLEPEGAPMIRYMHYSEGWDKEPTVEDLSEFKKFVQGQLDSQ